MVPAFCVRWLQAAGLSADEARKRAIHACQRASRYPFPLQFLYVWTVILVDYCAPLFFLARFRRFSALSSNDFEKLEKRLHQCKQLTLRAIFIFVRVPLWEQLTLEPKPTSVSEHPLSHKLSKPSDGMNFDVIIIGSGAGGAPIAWELSRAGLKVAIVESGSLIEPQTTAYALEHYYLQQSLTCSTKGGILPIFAGNTIGGTTPINSGTCLRPVLEQLKEWDQKLGTEFANGLLDKHFDTAERVLGVSVPPKSLLSSSAALFEKGLSALGRSGSYVLPRNAPQCTGSGRCCFGCPPSAKLGTDLVFLPEALENGCQLFAETRATAIHENNTGIRVSVKHGNSRYQLQARRVVLAGGGLGTPHLIRHNRLGTHWREAGKHLRIHPASKVFAYFPEAIHSEIGVPQGLGYKAPELPRVLFEGIFTPKATAGPVITAVGARHRWWLNQYDHLASFGLMVRERGEGRVINRGAWPLINYRMHPNDVADMMAGLILCGEIYLAAGAERVLLPLVGLQNEFTSIEQIRELNPRDYKHANLLNSGFHPQGTAAMGIVVNQDLSLKGTRNIFVCDASVLPASPGVNPMISIMGLALWLSDNLKA